jgi:hypothetical protein
MIGPSLIFITMGLIAYAGFVKLAARLLRYRVSWKSSFTFAVIVLVLVIFDHVLVFRQPVAIRIGNAVVLLLGILILGSWFFSERGTNRSGAVLGWGGGIRLIALAFAMAVVVAFLCTTDVPLILALLAFLIVGILFTGWPRRVRKFTIWACESRRWGFWIARGIILRRVNKPAYLIELRLIGIACLWGAGVCAWILFAAGRP